MTTYIILYTYNVDKNRKPVRAIMIDATTFSHAEQKFFQWAPIPATILQISLYN